MATSVYVNSILQSKRQLRTARQRRHIAYHLDYDYHGEAEIVGKGCYAQKSLGKPVKMRYIRAPIPVGQL